MGSTDRPGRAEHPEHSDRPTTVADQTDRYEHRVAEHYSQPANRDKLDPFTHMTSGEIKRLYLPDRAEVPPSGSIRVDGQEPKRPARSDGPYAEIEGNKVRLIDPATREIRWTAEHGDVKVQSDRMGDRIVNDETDKRSLRKQAQDVILRNTEDVTDFVKDEVNNANAVLGRTHPTGAHAEPRSGSMAADNTQHHGSPDLGTIVAVGIVGAAAAGRALDALGARRKRTPEEE